MDDGARWGLDLYLVIERGVDLPFLFFFLSLRSLLLLSFLSLVHPCSSLKGERESGNE